MTITDVRVRKITKEGKMKAVVSITLDDEFVETYDTVTDASISCGVNQTSAIVACCKHREHFNSAYGYKWFYSFDDL